jgi:FixJ family two-component response regulator
MLLDVHMPGMSGLELQEALNERGASIPVVFLSGSSAVPDAVAAMRAGAYDFVEKPFEPGDLLARVRRALVDGVAARRRDMWARELLRRAAMLTPREREVMDLIVTGKTSKESARFLGASHRTVEIHRMRVMEKMQAESLADLVRMQMTIAGQAS